MKRNLFTKSIAMGLAVSLTLSTTAFASVTGTGVQDPVEGEGTVKNPTYDVIVPLNADFYIDPFSTIETVGGSQIGALNMGVMNLSDAAISFSVAATVEADDDSGNSGADAVILMAKEDVVTNDISHTAKDAYIALVPAGSNIKTTNEETENAAFAFEVGNATYTTNNLVSATIAPDEISKDPAKLTFVLNKARYNDGELVGLQGVTGTTVQGTYTITVATAFVEGDTVVINGKTYTCTDITTGKRDFAVGADATSQANVLAPLIEADNPTFTATNALGVITLKEVAGGKSLAPTGAAGSGATGVISIASVITGLEASTTTATQANIAAFSLDGRLNPAGDWQDDDLKVSLVYDIRGMLSDTYASTIAGVIAGGQNLVGVQQAANAVALAAPKVTALAQTATDDAAQTVGVASNRSTGSVYIIKDGEAQASVANLNAAVAAKKGATASASATVGNLVQISTTDLVPGDYYAYAVDGDGVMSAKGANKITITTIYTPIAVAVVGGTYSKGSAANIVFNVTNGTGSYAATAIKNIIVTDSTGTWTRTWDGTAVNNATKDGLNSITIVGSGAISQAANGTVDVVITFTTATGESTWVGTITVGA